MNMIFHLQSCPPSGGPSGPALAGHCEKRLLLIVVAAAAALSTAAPGRAQTGYRPSAANLAAREWFQDARFGLFVHWGVYSVLGDGEWVMNNRKIPVADYEKLPAPVQSGGVRCRPSGSRSRRPRA